MPAALGNRAMFRLSVDGCDEELRVVRLRGHEAISSLFEFRLEIASGELALAALIGQDALLTIDGVEGERHVHGFVCQAEYIGDSRRYALYELTVVPWIWRLQQRASCRIFQQQTTPEILAAVLLGSGLRKTQFRLDLQAAYAARDYCTQYGETDLDLINRLMEADGIIYYFEHDSDQHILVLTDRGDCGHPAEGEVLLSWAPPQGVVHAGEHVTRLRLGELMRPERVSLRDMNLHTPAARLEVSEGSGTERELYEYPGSYQTAGKGGPDKGGQQAKLRLEALQAAGRRGFGTSDSPRLVAGLGFALAGHPRAGVDGEYRLVGVTHRGEQPQVLAEDTAESFHYSNDFECMDSKVPYRAPRVTPRPTVRGLQTAIVVGPPGEEVHVDEHGRVKVKFHWDRRDALDESSSCWVRVSQMWAGNGFGAMFLPRIGHEVLVDFIEGDPDRPMITGRIYTGFNKPPYALPDEKTKSTIKSDSSPGGGGFNELRFEDKKGSEQVFLHAQKDFDEVVLNNHTEDVGANETNKIGANQDTTVGADRTVHVKGNFTETIDGTETRTVTGAVQETFSATEVRDVSADQTETIGGNVTRAVSGNVTETVSGSVTETVSGALSQTVTGGITVNTPATVDITAVGGMTVTATGGIKMIAPAGFTLIAPGGTKTIDCDFWKFGGGQGDAFTWQIGISAIKFDAIGVQTTFNGVKCEYVALDILTAGFKLESKTLDLHMVVNKIHTAAIFLQTSGLTSIL